jgi:protoporphyrin/coproporphyrin ferrochelatase
MEKKHKQALIIANFGGPRNQEEVEIFLRTLLTDNDVIRTKLPSFLQKWIFSQVAKKRARMVKHDYVKIGGGSPIFEDTEAVAREASILKDVPILTFHRYLPQTHPGFLKQIRNLNVEEIKIFPMFPQFSYATTGSIARWLSNHLCGQFIQKIRWIKSYPDHPAFVRCMQTVLRDFLNSNDLKEEDTMLLFTAHGLPRSFICTGDIYESECRRSFESVSQGFPKALARLAYQSKFGPGEWLRPYTEDVCKNIQIEAKGHKNVVLIPLSFTSDHIETLFEIEQLYLPIIRQNGLNAYRCPALNRRTDWISAIVEISQENDLFSNQMLVRHSLKKCCQSCSKNCCFC